MSAYWKTLLRYVLDDTVKYEEIIPLIYNIIIDYHEQKIDIICDEDRIDDLRRCICQSDPSWALSCIKDTKRCFRCRDVFISEDISEINVRVNTDSKKTTKEFACNDCNRRTYDMGLYASDTESSSEESASESETDYEQEYLNRAELEDEIARGR